MIDTKTPGKKADWTAPFICLALAAMTFMVFGQTIGHGFVNFDDGDYVYQNPVVSQGLTWQGIRWAFSGGHASNWHPLTWLSHMMDCQLYGLHAGGHHLTSVLLHAVTAILLFLALREMTGAMWRSAFVAAVFAIHPLRVESVAWVAERKDVLSGLLFVLTVWVYARWARAGWTLTRRGLLLLLFALGLMCKPMLVTLPVVLLLLDYWPLRGTEPLRKLLIEKLPLIALSAASCVLTLVAQKGAIQTTDSFSLPVRLGNALASYMIYLWQMIWPAGLAVFYPLPRGGPPIWEMALGGAVLMVGSVLAWVWRRKRPWAFAGWTWYLVMLVPVVGIIQVGKQAHADRYTYLPQIGIYLAITWTVADWRVNRAVLRWLTAGALGVLMFCAWQQTGYWQDDETLWKHTLACTTNNYVAHSNLGQALLQEQELDVAIKQFQKALAIKPDNEVALNNLGTAHFTLGRIDDAISDFQKAIQIKPDFADAYYNLGKAYFQKGQLDYAITNYHKAMHIDGKHLGAHVNLGIVLMQQGKLDDAISLFQEALRINPNFAEAHSDLGSALRQKGSIEEAIQQFDRALKCDPNFADAHYNLANAYVQAGKLEEASIHYEQTVEIKPAFAEAQYKLGNVLCQIGRGDEAIAHYEQALRREPNNAGLLNNLAWLLATCPRDDLRNGAGAVELARKADSLTGGKNPLMLHTLAAALAESGQFPEAESHAQRALQLAEAQSNKGLAAQLKTELKLYQAKRPFHISGQ